MLGLLNPELLMKFEKSYLVRFTCCGLGVYIGHGQAPIISILPGLLGLVSLPVPAVKFSNIFAGFRDTDATDSEEILCVNCDIGWIGP